jgi:hypothetical protein
LSDSLSDFCHSPSEFMPESPFGIKKFLSFFFFLAVPEFELRALCLLDRCVCSSFYPISVRCVPDFYWGPLTDFIRLAP